MEQVALILFLRQICIHASTTSRIDNVHRQRTGNRADRGPQQLGFVAGAGDRGPQQLGFATGVGECGTQPLFWIQFRGD